MNWRLRHPVTLGVRFLLADNERIRFVKHTYRPGWFLPGGRPDRGESLASTARREAQEEAGVTIEGIELLGMVSHLSSWRSDHVSIFRANSFDRRPCYSREIERVKMFSLHALPDDTSDEALAVLQNLRSDDRGCCVV